jgi:alpha-mannosidase
LPRSRAGQYLLCITLLGPLSPLARASGDSPHAALAINSPSAQANPGPRPRLWIVPHTHWEGAVFKTREEYLEIGLPHILTALYLLEKYPDYRFVLDQVAYVRPFLERYPNKAAEFRKFVSEGRLQIVCANDVMLDVNIPSGESWVRQVLYGKAYCKRALGVDVTVGWALDTFGHHAQMPQLLKLAGYHSYWFQRGVNGYDVPSEFLWQGIDGTKIPAFWLPQGYGMFYPSPANLIEFSAYAREAWESLGHNSHWPDRVAVAGADVIDPEETLPTMIDEFDRQPNRPFDLRFAVPTDFESIVAKRGDEPVISGELNPVFQGIYSNRIEIKQWMRKLERILTTAEKLEALDNWLGASAKQPDIDRAWEPVLFNQAHDLTSGTMVDKVYNDTIRGYQYSETLGNAAVENGLDALATRVDCRGSAEQGTESMPVLVFNSLGWPRTDVASVQVGFATPGITSVRVDDPSGESIHVQPVEIERYPDGGIKDARLIFVAHNVPALGYSLYQVVPEKSPANPPPLANRKAIRMNPESSSTMHQDTGSIENEYYRATFNLWTGALSKLMVKSSAGDWNAIGNQPANVVAEEQDGGDFWELYGNLNGGRLTAMTTKQGLPPAGTSHLSTEWVGGDGITEDGPVYSEFRISHPFGSGSFATRVRLYQGVRRVDIETQLLNNDKFVRYRMLFPTSIATGTRFDEIPFGAIGRPADQEFPAQNWMDWSDGSRGVALLNCGLPGNNVASGVLLLSLLRSAKINAYAFEGGYEPGVTSDLGLELGEKRTFLYSVVPHSGDWRQAGVYRAAWEFNNPLVVRTIAPHAGSLPKRWGLVEISAPNVAVSALMPGANGSAIFRIYEADGRKTQGVKVRLPAGTTRVDEVNLIGEFIRSAVLQGDDLAFDLGPSEIKTFAITMQGSNGAGL